MEAIIDNKLSFQPWCEKITQKVDRRIVFIRRLVKTRKLSRLLTERLYQDYVRGFVNYGCCVWSLASTRFVDRNTCADRQGLRLCCGALLRTRTETLESEFSLELLQLHVKRLRIICCSRHMFFPELQTMKALLLECPKSFAHKKIYQEWSECLINVNVESFSLIRSLINHEILPRKRREKGK